MIRLTIKDAGTIKFSWGEWQELSPRAKETLICHGYDPPAAPHASFDHEFADSNNSATPHGDQLRSRIRTVQENRATKGRL